jgi:hypothetical protein
VAYQAHDNLGGTVCRKHRRVVTLASALLLGAGAIMNSLPAFAQSGDGGPDNSAGEGGDHAGIYTVISQASRGDLSSSSATITTPGRGYYYLQGHGSVPITVPPGRPVRHN